jgi:hypothetical protein
MEIGQARPKEICLHAANAQPMGIGEFFGKVQFLGEAGPLNGKGPPEKAVTD